MSKTINRRLNKLEGVIELTGTKGLESLTDSELIERLGQVCERLRTLFEHDIEICAQVKELEESVTFGRLPFDFKALHDLILSKVEESRP